MSAAEITVDDVRQIAEEAGAGEENWASLEWRLDNLYWIVDKQGKKVRFRLNPQQRKFVRNLWHRNVILKARQLGMSTLIEVMQLDQALFNTNHVGVVIADTLPNAGRLFKKIEFALEHLHPAMKAAFPLLSRTASTSIEFAHRDRDGKPHPSRVEVGVSARGGTVQFLHVSELGKIGLKYPQRAEEINTGAIPAVPLDGIAVIESTAEGAFGLLYDICEPAMKRAESKAPETPLDWRLHFFPWFEAEEYQLTPEDAVNVEIPPDLHKYFAKLEAELKIKIKPTQRAWYAKTRETLRRKMKQEYPSTPKEAFEQAIEGAILGDEMTRLREQGRLLHIGLDPHYPVNTFWDFGVGIDQTGGGDTHSIWFHQQVGVQHRWLYYVSGHGKGLRHWWIDVCEAHRIKHGYRWGRHFLPHDAETQILGEVVTTKRQILADMGMEDIVVVPRVQTIGQGIEVLRKSLAGNHWFDNRVANEELGEDMGCAKGIKGLDGYQFEWDEKRQIWSQKPLHNWASHPCDAFRQHAQGWTDTSSLEDEDDDRPRRQRNWRTA